MKKAISILLLAGSLILTGCGDSNTDYTQVSGQQGNPGPIVTPTPPVTQGWFVEVGGGAGNYATGDAFGSIQDASDAAAAANNGDQTITVRAGTYTETVTLANGQRLLGTPGGNRPVISGRIVLADGNTVDFIRVQDSNSDAIDGDGQNGGTVTNCEIASTTNQGAGIKANDATGNWTVTGNTVSNTAGISIDLTTSGTGQMRARVNDNTITGSAFPAIGFLAEDDTELVAQVHGNTMTGNQAGATFEAIAGNNATLSLDIEDNTNDDVYRFGSIDTSTINVEQFAQLEVINNSGTVNALTGTGFNPIIPVADGFCGF